MGSDAGSEPMEMCTPTSPGKPEYPSTSSYTAHQPATGPVSPFTELRKHHAKISKDLAGAMTALQNQSQRFANLSPVLQDLYPETRPGVGEWRSGLAWDETMEGGVGSVMQKELVQMGMELKGCDGEVKKKMAVSSLGPMLQDLENHLGWIVEGAGKKEEVIAKLETLSRSVADTGFKR